MSRRSMLAALIAAALSSPLTGPALSPANAADPCFTFTDPAGDTVFEDDPSKTVKEPSLDITGVTFTTADDNLIVTLAMPNLTALAQNGSGDSVTVEFHVLGKQLRYWSERYAGGALDGAGTYVDGTNQGTAVVDSVYDIPGKTLTIKQPLTDLEKWVGFPVAGGLIRKMSAKSWTIAGLLLEGVDEATPPWNTAYQIGKPCGVTPGLPAPAIGKPADACLHITDPAADGKFYPATAAGTRLEAPDDQSLDITGVSFRTSPTELMAYIKVTNLVVRPAGGHRFDFTFKHAGKVVLVTLSQMDSVYTVAFTVGRTTSIGGTVTNGVIGTAQFDVPNDLIILGINLADLQLKSGEPVTNGTVMTDVQAKSNYRAPGGTSTFPADTAPNVTSPETTVAVGDNKCFPPPPAKLASVTAPASVQHTDKAAVSAKLTDEAGAALPGKSLTFTAGTDKVTAVTGADGIARASLPTTRAAGSYTMTVGFAGDAEAAAVSGTAPANVVAEVTKTAVSVAKSGTRRTVTVTLTDNDKAAVAGQTVTWYVNGAKKATSKTDSKGKASYGGARSGQTVKVVFAGVSKKFTGSQSQVRV